MAFQAGCLISVVPGGGGPDLDREIRPYNVRRDLRSPLQTLRRQTRGVQYEFWTKSPLCVLVISEIFFGTVLTVTEARNYGALLSIDGINKKDQNNENNIMILSTFCLIPKSA